MTTSIYMNIADMPGESRDAAHPDEIDVLRVSWGFRDRAHFSDATSNADRVTVTKYIDTATTPLLNAIKNRVNIPEIKISYSKSGSGSMENFMTITLSNAMAIEVSSDSEPHGDRILEYVSFVFESALYEYEGPSRAGMMFEWSRPDGG